MVIVQLQVPTGFYEPDTTLSVRLSVQSVDRSSGDCIVVLHCVDSGASTRCCLSVRQCSCMRVSRGQVCGWLRKQAR